MHWLRVIKDVVFKCLEILAVNFSGSLQPIFIGISKHFKRIHTNKSCVSGYYFLRFS